MRVALRVYGTEPHALEGPGIFFKKDLIFFIFFDIIILEREVKKNERIFWN